MKGRRVLTVVGGALVALALLWALTLRPDPVDTDEPVPPPVMTPAAPRDGQEATEEGARAAALTFVEVSQRWLYLTDAEIERELAAITTPDSAELVIDETLADVRTARDPLSESSGRVWWVVRPLASDVEALTSTQARVAVWAVTVLSAADVAVPQADWVTVRVSLEFVDGRWLLDDITDEAGPTPRAGVRDEPWEPEPFDDALDGFDRVGAEAS
jgi:hypothetical protein